MIISDHSSVFRYHSCRFRLLLVLTQFESRTPSPEQLLRRRTAMCWRTPSHQNAPQGMEQTWGPLRSICRFFAHPCPFCFVVSEISEKFPVYSTSGEYPTECYLTSCNTSCAVALGWPCCNCIEFILRSLNRTFSAYTPLEEPALRSEGQRPESSHKMVACPWPGHRSAMRLYAHMQGQQTLYHTIYS